MVKSRRARPVILTQTKKKGNVRKEQLINNIRDCTDKYNLIISFRIQGMRNVFLKEIRQKMNTSRFFLGRNKLMQLALGRDEETEVKTGLADLADHLTGACGLCFTNLPREEVLSFFREYREDDYARSGFVATEDIEIPAGPLPPQFEFSMEQYLRNQLLMPTEIRGGKVCLVHEYTVCKKGKKLTPEQARVLKLLDKKMSSFFFDVTAIAQKDEKDENKFVVESFEDEEKAKEADKEADEEEDEDVEVEEDEN